jgi:hypothetical protein
LVNVRLTRLKAAEVVMGDVGEVIECKDHTIKALASYMTGVFLSAEYSYDGIGKALCAHIRDRYIRSNGDRKMNELFADYSSFYSSLEESALMSHNLMSRIFSGRPGLFGYICQLGLFIGISPQELLNMKEDTGNEAIYALVAGKTGEPIDKVRIIGEALLAEWKRSKVPFLRTERQRDYLADEDQRLLPRVKETAEEIYGQGDIRPRKVSLALVSTALHVDFHRLKKMKRCMEVLDHYHETQEQYWAREIIWAVEELERRGEPLNFKHIRNLTNLRRENIEDSLEELRIQNEDIYYVIKSMM